jgi:hypothetical protein
VVKQPREIKVLIQSLWLNFLNLDLSNDQKGGNQHAIDRDSGPKFALLTRNPPLVLWDPLILKLVSWLS